MRIGDICANLFTRLFIGALERDRARVLSRRVREVSFADGHVGIVTFCGMEFCVSVTPVIRQKKRKSRWPNRLRGVL